MEQKILSAEPRRTFSNGFRLQMVKLVSQLGTSAARIAREHDTNNSLLFKWLRLWQNEGYIPQRLPVTTPFDAGVELLPVEIMLDEQKEPMAAPTPLLSTPSQSTVSVSSCKVEFHHGNMTPENSPSELLMVLVHGLTGRGR